MRRDGESGSLILSDNRQSNLRFGQIMAVSTVRAWALSILIIDKFPVARTEPDT